jgi:hypothetical protein
MRWVGASTKPVYLSASSDRTLIATSNASFPYYYESAWRVMIIYVLRHLENDMLEHVSLH